MLSLGGAIGTGLFMGSGEVISQAGPLGAVLAYIIGGLIAYMVMLCLGELAVHLPVSGSFGAFATRYIGPGTGYMVSWMYWLGWSAPNLQQQPFWYRNGSHKRRSGYGR